MREKIKILVLTDIIFLALLMLSGMISGLLSTVIYFLAFVIPFAFAILSSKTSLKSKEFLLPVKNPDITIAGVFPTIITVIVISSVTAFIMNHFGKTQNVELGDNIFSALLLHALLPALLEEGLFRYLPMKLLARENGRACVLISALLFALSHHSVFSFFYAFVAGVSFMLIDIIADSVIPSLVIHLLNNALSVILMFYPENVYLSIAVNSAVAILACCSLVYLFIIRRRVAEVLSERLVTREKYKFSYEILLFIIPTLLIAVGEIMS